MLSISHLVSLYNRVILAVYYILIIGLNHRALSTMI